MSEVERAEWLAYEREHREQREVLDRLVEGRRAAAIAAEFVVSLTTVRSQIRSILLKLQVRSQLEAVALVRERRRW